MKAVLVKEPGDASQLYIGETDKPTLKPHEILVKIHSFALNRMDILQRHGNYPVPKGASQILGVECAGDVVECGSEAKKFKVGDKVFGLMYGGAYAEYAAMDEGMAMSMGHTLTYEQAASIPEAWFTAYQALHFITGIQRGNSILIHAAASGVGIAAIQLAKAAGASKILATAGNADKIKFVEELGADKGINYKTEKFDEVVLRETDNKGVDIIIDFVGQDYWLKNIKSLAIDGRMALLGFMSGSVVEKFDLAQLLAKRLRIEGTGLRSRSKEYQTRLANAVYRDVIATHFCKSSPDSQFKLFIDKVFDWKDIKAAHEHMEANANIGKIVVNMS